MTTQKHAIKNFDYTTIADRLWTGTSQPPNWCGLTGLRDPNLPPNRKSYVMKRTHIKKFVNYPYKDQGTTANQSGEVLKIIAQTSNFKYIFVD